MDADERHADDGGDALAERYLDLVKGCLTRTLFPERWRPYESRRFPRRLFARLATAFARRPLEVVRRVEYDPLARETGRDWPAEAETMVGRRRLDHLQACVATVVKDDVPGDLMETGVWRGGASILMRATLEAYGDRGRRVWLADSFEGLPPPDPTNFPADAGLDLHRKRFLAVPLDEVKRNFARYGLLDDRVRFLPGWFRDTLRSAPVTRLSILRMDGDLYESTWQALESLYPRLSLGGFAVVDDYGSVEACRRAVDEYRSRHGVVEPIEAIDDDGVFWRRQAT
jgi:O-methyltransferase